MTIRLLRSCTPLGPYLTPPPDPGAAIVGSYSGNLGNLLFDQLLADELVADSVGHVVDERAVGCTVIVSVANYLSSLTARPTTMLEQLASVAPAARVIVAGLGLQATSLRDVFDHDRIEALRRIGDTGAVGVRGYDTAAVLEAADVTRGIEVIGCPSLYRLVERRVDGPRVTRPTQIFVAATPSGGFRDVVSHLLEFGRRHDATYVVQTEAHFLAGSKEQMWSTAEYLASGAPGLDPAALAQWLGDGAKAYWTLPEWTSAMGPGALYVGTRFHSAVAALLGGGRALLIPTDRRTRELATYHSLPVIAPDDFNLGLEPDELWALADPTVTLGRAQAVTRRQYEFFRSHGIPLRSPAPDEGEGDDRRANDWDSVARVLGAGEPRAGAGLEGRVDGLRSDVELWAWNRHPFLVPSIRSGDVAATVRSLRDIANGLERSLDQRAPVATEIGSGIVDGSSRVGVSRGARWQMKSTGPRFRSLVIVTYGRSGSTLMQGMLNSSPDTLIRGENNFFLLPLYQAYQRLEWAHRGDVADSARIDGALSAWFGADELSPSAMLDDLRALVERQLIGNAAPRPSVLGFKEIRWHDVPPADWPAMVEWIEQMFPDVGFVLHRRDLGEVRRSGWWATGSDETFENQVGLITRMQDELAELRPDTTIVTDHADLAGRSEQALLAIAAWLGYSDPEPLVQTWRRTLELPHSTPSEPSP